MKEKVYSVPSQQVVHEFIDVPIIQSLGSREASRICLTGQGREEARRRQWDKKMVVKCGDQGRKREAAGAIQESDGEKMQG